jgi:trk system potassium uptake protein TrkH
VNKSERLILATLLLSVAGLFIEQRPGGSLVAAILVQLIDFSVMALIVAETAMELASTPYRAIYLKKHWFAVAYAAAFALFFLYSKAALLLGSSFALAEGISILLRNAFLVMKVLGRFGRVSRFAQQFFVHPAQTTIASFAAVILAGSLLLMMPFAVANGDRLSILDAVFTSASAVCVTGLVVVDTPVFFSLAGQIVIILLIQIGGLGIMAFSYFAVFSIRRKTSLGDRLMVSYMLSEGDITDVSATLKKIVLTTVSIELGGAALLYLGFGPREGWGPGTVFLAVFHSVSAFCNAGFALFTDSLEGFRRDPLVLLTVSGLIILGGISFSVLGNLAERISIRLPLAGRRAPPGAGLFPRLGRTLRAKRPPLSPNTAVVLKMTAGLLLAGLVGFYLLEHDGAMSGYGLGEQYLSAFFQSVTCRTAGFGTLPFGSLKSGTLLFAIALMFVGGASGSTAGGVKVNSVAAIGAYFRSFLRSEKAVLIGRHSLPFETVGKAFIVVAFGGCAVLAGTFALAVFEKPPFIELLFEAVSAFGTVGLSTGITSSLGAAGKVVLIVLMFLGRIGPLTVLAAARKGGGATGVSYPAAEISI